MTTGLFIGRFQPFHNGHMKDIHDILKECEKIIICIGSAEESRTAINPFTYNQRKDMIKLTLNTANIPEKRYEIIAITDINNNDLWVGHVEKYCHTFDIVYTGNSLVKKLFKNSGYTVKDISISNNLSSSMIRERMTLGIEWKKYVPEPVANYLENINAPACIKKSENNSTEK